MLATRNVAALCLMYFPKLRLQLLCHLAPDLPAGRAWILGIRTGVAVGLPLTFSVLVGDPLVFHHRLDGLCATDCA